MMLKGTVTDGVVVFDNGSAPPDGTRVEVIVKSPVPLGPSLFERLKNVVGKAKGLPADASQRVDHYLTHGLPEP